MSLLGISMLPMQIESAACRASHVVSRLVHPRVMVTTGGGVGNGTYSGSASSELALAKRMAAAKQLTC